jgi:alginate O-acetyltransferase complex protein AlgI
VELDAMLFCTFQFVVFFAIVFAAYWTLPWDKARVWLLLAASFYFYARWNRWLAVLVCGTTVLDYLIARGLESATASGRRRLLLFVSLGMNVGLLCYFKYANFFLRSLEDALHAAGATASLPVLRVILPVGISFYTFEAISYTVDVYRRRISAERNLAHFLLFILFFPHLVAGPVVRARDFLPQSGRRKRWSWPRLHLGMRLFVMGLFKKLAIADHMAQYADPVFANPGAYGTQALWSAAFAYALQVYCDFSGYTDMALGAAHALGYKLTRNFDRPYLSANIAEFWRRWHISLSTWLRDYLFFPLGGSRGGQWRTARNLIITMTLGGLWHGASWPFVVFGFIHGSWLSAHRLFRQWCEARPRLDAMLQSTAGTALRIAGTFTAFTCTLVVFRSQTLWAGGTMLGSMFTGHAGLGRPLAIQGLLATALAVALGHTLGGRQWWRDLAVRLPAPVRGFGYAAAVCLALLLTPGIDKAFIYFQF